MMKAFTLLVLVLQLVRANFTINTKNVRQTDQEEIGEVSGTHSEDAFQNNLAKMRVINDDYSDNQGDGQKVERKLPDSDEYNQINSDEESDEEGPIDISILQDGTKITDKNWERLEKRFGIKIEKVEVDGKNVYRVVKNDKKVKASGKLAWFKRNILKKKKDSSNSNSGKLRFLIV